MNQVKVRTRPQPHNTTRQYLLTHVSRMWHAQSCRQRFGCLRPRSKVAPNKAAWPLCTIAHSVYTKDIQLGRHTQRTHAGHIHTHTCKKYTKAQKNTITKLAQNLHNTHNTHSIQTPYTQSTHTTYRLGMYYDTHNVHTNILTKHPTYPQCAQNILTTYILHTDNIYKIYTQCT